MVRQGRDLGVRHAVHHRVHVGVGAAPRAVAVLRQGADQVLLALPGQARDLGAAGVGRQVANAAVQPPGQRLALADEFRVGPAAVRRRAGRQRGEMRRQILDFPVLQTDQTLDFGRRGSRLHPLPYSMVLQFRLWEQVFAGPAFHSQHAFGIEGRP